MPSRKTQKPSTPEGNETFSMLAENGDRTYTLSDKHGNDWNFDSSGRLTSWVDCNGNTTSYTSAQVTGGITTGPASLAHSTPGIDLSQAAASEDLDGSGTLGQESPQTSPPDSPKMISVNESGTELTVSWTTVARAAAYDLLVYSTTRDRFAVDAPGLRSPEYTLQNGLSGPDTYIIYVRAGYRVRCRWTLEEPQLLGQRIDIRGRHRRVGLLVLAVMR